MRISAHRQDSGYDPITSHGCQVLLNGEDITSRCYTADEELGKVWCYVLNGEGKVRMKDGMCKTETLFGRVEIKLKS